LVLTRPVAGGRHRYGQQHDYPLGPRRRRAQEHRPGAPGTGRRHAV